MLRIILFLAALILFSHAPYAQETPPSVADTFDENPPDDNSQNDIFSQASDAQLLEAKKYYKACESNDIISKQKDCRCAAGAYLEARIKLGAKAPATQIIDSIKNLCLTTPDAPILERSIDDSSISDELLEDVQTFYDQCTSNAMLMEQYDCDCLAGYYAEERETLGPLVSQTAIFVQIKGRCVNTTQLAGDFYTSCMKDKFLEKYNILPKTLCECIARSAMDEIKAKGEDVPLTQHGIIYSRAKGRCLDSLNLR